MAATFPQHALRRGSVHALLGLAISFVFFYYGRNVTAILLAVTTLATLSVEVARLRIPLLNRWFMYSLRLVIRNGEERTFCGATFFLLGALATTLIFPREIAIPAIVFLALGDPAAGVIGIWKGRTRMWNKTIEGGIACLVVCLTAAILMAGVAERPSLTVLLIGAVSATVFQGAPLHMNDNVTIPVGSALVMRLAGMVL